MNYSTIALYIFCFLGIQITVQGQSSVTTNLTDFTLCDLNVRTGNIENCTEHDGQVVYSSVEVVPNKSITLFFKDPDENGESITKHWDFSELSMNNAENLFIYDFVEGDLNLNGGMTLNILMRLDYSVQEVISTVNQKGEILVIRSHGEEL